MLVSTQVNYDGKKGIGVFIEWAEIKGKKTGIRWKTGDPPW